jgi:hypothetical protein
MPQFHHNLAKTEDEYEKTKMKTIDSFESFSFSPCPALPCPSNWGMKQRLEGQTRHERRGDFMDNSIILNLIFFLPALSLIHIAAQKTKRAQKEEGDPKQESGKRERVRGRALL